MKFSILKPVFLAFLLLAGGVAGALENGRDLGAEEKIALSGVVAVSFDSDSIGTATYLGNGFFLTAAHNLLGLGEGAKKAKFSVYVGENELISEISQKEFKILLPPSDRSKKFSTSTGAEVEIPLPDLMIIQVAAQHFAKLKSLKPLRIQRHPFQQPEVVASVGMGVTDFMGLQWAKQMQIGFVLISAVEEGSIAKTYWVQGSEYAAPRFGDSGGPLLRYDTKAKEIFIVRVTNSVILGEKDFKNASIGKYQLLSDPKVSQWLQKIGF